MNMNDHYIVLANEVADEVEHITSALPGKVFYSADGEVLILADEGKYIIRVTPPSVILPGFNNGNPTTESAYLVTQPPIDLVPADNLPTQQRTLEELEGWSTGWEC